MSQAPAPRPTDRLRQEAVLWLAGARLGLWVLPFRTLRRLLPWVAERLPSPDPSPPNAATIARAVEAAPRAVPRATCLAQALATWAMLRRRGTHADLHLGVQPPGPEAAEAPLSAHAWVEVDGDVVIGGDVSTQRGLGSLPLGRESA